MNFDINVRIETRVRVMPKQERDPVNIIHRERCPRRVDDNCESVQANLTLERGCKSSEPLGSEFLFGGVWTHDLPFKIGLLYANPARKLGQIRQHWEQYKIELAYPKHDNGYAMRMGRTAK